MQRTPGPDQNTFSPLSYPRRSFNQNRHAQTQIGCAADSGGAPFVMKPSYARLVRLGSADKAQPDGEQHFATCARTASTPLENWTIRLSNEFHRTHYGAWQQILFTHVTEHPKSHRQPNPRAAQKPEALAAEACADGERRALLPGENRRREEKSQPRMHREDFQGSRPFLGRILQRVVAF